jgi:hypothetical protein
MRLGILALVALSLAAVGEAEPYWIEWDGSDWPENTNPGWVRSWGNWQGPHQGGAYRTLENGVLTYDSLYDPGVYDWYYMQRPGLLDPGPGQVLLVEWKLWTEQVVGWYGDRGLAVHSDQGRYVLLVFNEGSVFSVCEQKVIAYLQPGQFHEFALWSTDMSIYHLGIDGEEVATGVFHQGVSTSLLSWGDLVQGAASLHHWTFVRYGVVPAPQAGDVNCDGSFDFADINPFVQALSNWRAWQSTYPGCWTSNVDMNGDGSVGLDDINPFVEALLAG